MLRWLACVLVLGLCAPADAQVFRPKAGAKRTMAKARPAAPPSEEDDSDTKKASAKKAPAQKRVTGKKKAAEESPAKDKDFVKIWDDDEVE